MADAQAHWALSSIRQGRHRSGAGTPGAGERRRMILYLIRHAIAEEARTGLKDQERALTAEGIAKFHRAARGMVRLMGEGAPRVIWTSPLVRSRQTAELLA